MTSYKINKLRRATKGDKLIQLNDDIFYTVPPEIDSPITRGQWREYVIHKMYHPE